ncbi:MAG TPA: response regulator [Chitinophagaceae bacterium]|jgi:CheY-like chemotaxis protein|nr:response regulator [Chitinophagaceae bacterium]
MNLPDPTEPYTVLYIDDDQDDHLAFQEAVQEACPGAGITSLFSTDDALAFIRDRKPDIVFVDLDMPGKGGLKCILEIRQAEDCKQVPVIVYSSTSRHSNIQAAYEIGANLFVTKPESFPQLKRILHAVFQLDWSRPEAITEQHQSNFYYRAFNLE